MIQKRMECRITDSDIQEPEDLFNSEGEIDVTDTWRQMALDDARNPKIISKKLKVVLLDIARQAN